MSSEDLYMTVENYLNEISPVVSPHTSPNGSSSGSKRRSGDRLQRPNSGSNDRRSIGSFEPRKLASSSITTTWVKTLNELCQICPPPTVGSGGGGGRVYGVLQANFDTTPVHGGGQAFRVELKLWRPIMPSPQDPDADSEELVEKVYQNDGPFPSKKHAREAIAKLAVEWLEDEIDTRKVKLGKTKGTKLASDRGGRLAGGNAVPGMDGWGVIITEGDGKNWVGMLNDYILKKRITLPDYTEYATYGNTFTCEARLAPFMIIGEAPTVLTELEHKVFGDLKIRYANKKLAKSAAAKAVMEYLMEKDPVLASGKDTVLQPPSPGGKKKKGLEAKSSSKVVEVPSEMGYREKLNFLAPRLWMGTPEYKLTGSNGMYDASLFLGRPSEEKDMLIGPVRNVYGKERAKTEIAKHALPIIVQEAKKMGFTILGLEGFEPEEQSTDGTESEPPGESGHNGAEDEEIWEDASDGVNIGSGMMGQVDCNAAGVVGLSRRGHNNN